MRTLLDQVAKIMTVDGMTIEQRALKTAEETGELCEAVCSAGKAPCTEYKGKTKVDVVEEAADVVICALSVAIMIDKNYTMAMFERVLQAKMNKWQALVDKTSKSSES